MLEKIGVDLSLGIQKEILKVLVVTVANNEGWSHRLIT